MEKAALAAVIESGWITTGDEFEEFERVRGTTKSEDSIESVLHRGPPFPCTRSRSGDYGPILSVRRHRQQRALRLARPIFVDIAFDGGPLDVTGRGSSQVHSQNEGRHSRAFWWLCRGSRRLASIRSTHGLLLIEDAAHAPGLPIAETLARRRHSASMATRT